jgi:tRNA-modifying protein YgfZ
MQQTSDSMAATRGVGRILVAGADAEAFLQGQLTQDVRKLGGDASLIAGYCSAKGRLLAVLQMQRVPEGIVLETHRSVLESTLKRLRMFVLRSKVTLTEIEPAVVESGDDSWRRARIERGLPTIFLATADHFVPQMCNLDVLGGISFDKGCYTGQEIVARLHYLGQVKRRMYRATLAGQAAAGDPVYDASAPSQAIGEIVDALDGRALAVLQVGHAAGDLRLGSAQGEALDEVVALASA